MEKELTIEKIEELTDSVLNGTIVSSSALPSMEELLAFEDEHRNDPSMFKKCRSFRYLVSDFNKRELSREQEVKKLYERLEKLANEKPIFLNPDGSEYHGLIIYDENHEKILSPEGMFTVSEEEKGRFAEIRNVYEQLEELNQQSSLDETSEIETPRLK